MTKPVTKCWLVYFANRGWGIRSTMALNNLLFKITCPLVETCVIGLILLLWVTQ